MILISVIIPIYNAEKYIDRCLKSVMEQSLQEIQIILINDGSTDNSLEICKLYAQKDNRIEIINQSNRGVSYSRNQGIDKARGKYIMFIDADDWIEKNACELLYKQLNVYEADTGISCYYVEDKVQFVREMHLKETCIEDKEITEKILMPLVSKKTLAPNIFINYRANWMYIFSNQIIKENNIRFNEKLCIGEDFLFNVNYLKFSKRLFVNSIPYYHYTINNNSLYRRYKENLYSMHCILRKNIEELLLNQDIHERLKVLHIHHNINNIINEIGYENKKTIKNKLKFIKSQVREIANYDTLKTSSGLIFQTKIMVYLIRKRMSFLIYLIIRSKNLLTSIIKWKGNT